MTTKKTTATSTKKTAVKADTKTKALAVAKTPAPKKPKLDLTTMFSSLDVVGLNKAVEDIANRQGTLSSEEKKNALVVVDKWEHGIVEQIKNERNKIEKFCDNVESFSRNYEYMIDNPEYIEPLHQIIVAAGLDKKLKPIGDAREAVKELEEELRILREFGYDTTDGMTEMQIFAAQQEFEKKKFLKEQELKKAKRKVERLISELSLELNKNKSVKLSISKLRTMSSMLLKNQSECAAKANSAKLAISIDDGELRAKLQALVLVTLK